jgi:hypothetical protein
MNRNFLKMDMRNEKGSALITAVLILMVVTVIGIIATRTSNMELQIATNEKVHKMTWFATDAVCDELSTELIEQNIEQRGFGSQAPPFEYGASENLMVYTSELFMNTEGATCASNVPEEDNRDIAVSGLGQSVVSVRIYGNTELSSGNAIQLPEGYHGRGKGLAGGGAQIVYVIRGLGRGAVNSEARIAAGWRHVI